MWESFWRALFRGRASSGPPEPRGTTARPWAGKENHFLVLPYFINLSGSAGSHDVEFDLKLVILKHSFHIWPRRRWPLSPSHGPRLITRISTPLDRSLNCTTTDNANIISIQIICTGGESMGSYTRCYELANRYSVGARHSRFRQLSLPRGPRYSPRLKLLCIRYKARASSECNAMECNTWSPHLQHFTQQLRNLLNICAAWRSAFCSCLLSGQLHYLIMFEQGTFTCPLRVEAYDTHLDLPASNVSDSYVKTHKTSLETNQ